MEQNKRPHVSVSRIKMYFRCGEMYRRRVIEKEPLIPTIPLHKGSGVHTGAEINFKQKIKSFQDLPKASIIEAAVSGFETRFKKEGVALTAEEEKIGLDLVIGKAKDRTAVLAGMVADYVAPAHQPVIVEQDQRIELMSNLDLWVKLDMINTRNEIVDYKSSKRSLNQADIDQDIQYTLYALTQKSITKADPGPIVIENLVDTGKNTKYNPMTTSRNISHFKKAIEQINIFIAGLKSGVFLPAEKGSWYCNEEHCGYARTCKFYQFYKQGGGARPKPFWFGRKKKK